MSGSAEENFLLLNGSVITQQLPDVTKTRLQNENAENLTTNFLQLSSFRVLVVVLALNFFIWISIIVWRIMFCDGLSNASRRCFRGLRTLLQLSSHPQSQDNTQAASGEPGLDPGDDAPPPYEEAIKSIYPSISSLLTMNTEIPSSDLINNSNQASHSLEAEVSSQRQVEVVTSATPPANIIIMDDAVNSPRVPQSSSKKQRHVLRSLSCGQIEHYQMPK